MGRWYGIGGSWIERGLPHCVPNEKKPESGCEIQNVFCGESRIMLRLQIVKSSKDTIRDKM